MNVLLAHGSSDGRHGEQVHQLCEQVSRLLDEPVQAGFLSEKKLPQRARVLPLFLGGGEHMSRDVPMLIEASGGEVLPPLNANLMAEMAFDLATHGKRKVNVLFAAYRFADFKMLNAALYRLNKRCSKMALASMHSEPSVTSVLQHWFEQSVTNIQLQPMLLFEGRTLSQLSARMRDQVSNMASMDVSVGDVLCKHDNFASVVADVFKGSL